MNLETFYKPSDIVGKNGKYKWSEESENRWMNYFNKILTEIENKRYPFSPKQSDYDKLRDEMNSTRLFEYQRLFLRMMNNGFGGTKNGQKKLDWLNGVIDGFQKLMDKNG